MSEDRAYRISGFPSGVWWLRWIDTITVISPVPGMPTVTVALSPLFQSSSGPVRLADVAKDATDCRSVEVAAGLISGLAIGMIFEDGRFIGRLEAEERAFDFDLPGDRLGQFQANEDPDLDRPAWWTAARYDVLSASAYPRVIRSDSFCAVLRAEFDKAIAVIPAAEVVRAFIATHSDIATAAFSGPWEAALDDLVDVDASGIDEDGNWRVVARGGKVDRGKVVAIASLMKAFNPAGAKAANMLHSTVIARGGRISAALPFESCRLRFKARCLKLHSGKYLVTEIVRAQWPHTQGVVLVEPGPLEDIDGDATQRSYPVEALALPYNRSDPIDVVSDDAPAQASDMARMVAGLTWEQLPAPEVIKGDARKRPDRIPIPRPDSVADAASVGATASRSPVAQATVGQIAQPGPCDRFESIAKMFDGFAANDAAFKWRALPEPGRSRRVGSRDVWAFPNSVSARSGGWSLVDRGRRIHRSAMVCEIVMKGGRSAYWIEIEPRPGEAFRSLVFTAPQGGTAVSIKRLLGHALVKRGVWGDAAALARAVGLRGAATWRHGPSLGGGPAAARAIKLLEGLP